MQRHRLFGLSALLLLLSACVTINIYFPAAQAEKAAERIVEDIIGKPADSPTQQPEAKDKTDKGAWMPSRWPAQIAGGVLELLIPSAHAASPDFNVDSPAIRRLQAQMKARHGNLAPFYAAGAIGYANNGLVAIRDNNAIPLKDRRQVRDLVDQENADRDALYRAIAEANGHPEWEKDVRAVFAQQWVQKAGKGWWVQDANGNWRRK